MGRIRIRESSSGGGGRYIRYATGILRDDLTQGPVVLQRDYCDDLLGRTTDHPMDIIHTSKLIKPLNGRTIPFDPKTYRQITGWMPGFQADLSPGHLPDPKYPTTTEMATRLLAMTNPGRASVSLPVFIGELRDLPSMVRLAGNSILKRTSGAYLSWEFGWKPLISDVRKLLDFQSTVSKRVKELERLYGKGGLKRRMNLGASGVESVSNVAIESSTSLVFRANQKIFTKRQSWGTVRWKPIQIPSLASRPDLNRLARKAVFGLSIQAEDAWNLIPWTWLIDWFSNCGDFLQAHGNRVPCVPSVPNIMTKTETKIDYTRTDSHTWCSGGDSTILHTTLSRRVQGAGLAASLPFLSKRQLSILGALAIQRLRR